MPLYLHACEVRFTVGDSGLCCTCVTLDSLFEDVPLVEFICFVVTRMPGESYRR